MNKRDRKCSECDAEADDLDIVCSSCGALLVEPEVVEAEYIPPSTSLLVKAEIEPDAEETVRRIGSDVAEKIFGSSPLSRLIGSAVGGFIGREMKAGTKLVEVGTEGRRRRFPTAVPTKRKRRKKRKGEKS